MKHIKLFENFTLERDLFTEITEEEFIDLDSKRVDIDKYYKKILLSYPQSKIKHPKDSGGGSSSFLYIDIIEKSDGTNLVSNKRYSINKQTKLELMVMLTDDDWFIVSMDEYELIGSWRPRELDTTIDGYTETSYWKCDQIEGLMAFLDTVNGDMWSFMTH